MKSSIDVAPEHLVIVKEILQKHLPTNAHVWVFGSRVHKTKKKYSDLDLVIDLNKENLSIELLTNLAYDFDESDLPYKVDIVDWNAIDESFRKIIQHNKILLDWEK